MNDPVTRLMEAYSECQERVMESLVEAQNEAEEIGQRYAAEVAAAGGGDDAMERARQAWLAYISDMSKVHHDYASGLREQQRAWTAVVQEVQAEAADAAYEAYVEGLRSLGLAQDQPGPSPHPPAKPATGKKGSATTKQPPSPE